jgi:hypothetical protein
MLKLAVLTLNRLALWIALLYAGFRNPSGHSFALLRLPNLQYPIIH